MNIFCGPPLAARYILALSLAATSIIGQVGFPLTGTVTDLGKAPLENVTVILKGARETVTTKSRSDGSYAIELRPGGYAGYSIRF